MSEPLFFSSYLLSTGAFSLFMLPVLSFMVVFVVINVLPKIDYLSKEWLAKALRRKPLTQPGQS